MKPIILGSNSLRFLSSFLPQITSLAALRTARYLQFLEGLRFRYFSETYGGLYQLSSLVGSCDIHCLHGDGLNRIRLPAMECGYSLCLAVIRGSTP